MKASYASIWRIHRHALKAAADNNTAGGGDNLHALRAALKLWHMHELTLNRVVCDYNTAEGGATTSMPFMPDSASKAANAAHATAAVKQ